MKRIISILLALALVLSFSLVVVAPVAANGTTYYVATTGNDGNTGSAGSPWLTIQYAINTVAGGDTIMVAAGTYNEEVEFDNTRDGITLSGANAGIPGTGARGAESIIEWNNVLEEFAINILDGADGVVIDGFTVKSGDDIFNVRSDDVVIKNNIITPSAAPITTNAPGIFACECNNLTVSYNWLYDIGPSGGVGMYLGLAAWSVGITNSLIEHNLIENSGGAGIMFNYSLVGSNNTVEYNEIKNVGDDGIRTGNAHDVAIQYNEIYGSGRDGVRINTAGTAASHTVNYNSIYSNGGDGVNNRDGGATLDAEDNWWGDDSGPSVNGPGTGDSVSTNVDFDPWTTGKALTHTGTGIASFTPSAGTITVTAVPTPPGAPVTLPHGMFSFNVTGLASGQTVIITIELPGPVPVGSKWWKYQAGAWYSLPIGDDDGDNIIKVTLTDKTPTNSGSGDEDAVAGQITDDGGSGNPTVGWETYPINKVRVLLPWIALLAAIMAGSSLLVLRRRRVHS